jgi:tetratricopeptide (TPR) repeat protein
MQTERFQREWASASSIEYDSLADLAISIANSTKGSGQLAITPLLFKIDIDDTKRSRDFIEALRSKSNLPGEILAFLGTSAASKDQFDVARTYLTQAIEAEPDLQTAWNNYAYVLDKGFPEEIANARSAADKAVLLNPKDVHARDTRADILIRAQDWAAAIEDLKLLTNASYSPKSVHARLAMAYKALGNKKLASTHERLAEQTN